MELQDEFLNLVQISRGFDQNKAVPIRIHFDTSALQTQVDDKKLLQLFYLRDFLINKVIPTAIQFYQTRIKINIYPSFQNVIRGKNCAEIQIPSTFTAPEADLYIFATAKNEPQREYSAWATSCYTHFYFKRPVAGQINFNMAKLQVLNNKVYNDFTMTVLHEMMHIMGFSQGLYEYFVDSNNQALGLNQVQKEFINEQGKKVLGLITPNLIKFAQNYWGCQSIQYVPLENDGGAAQIGSHWERAIFFNEVMTAAQIKDRVFSGFTFNLLKDAGWYQVDESKFEDFFIGRNMGCEWQKACHSRQNFDYFCYQRDDEGCNFDHSSIGYCDDFLLQEDGCQMIKSYSNQQCNDETYDEQLQAYKDNFKMSRGVNSKCFATTIVKKGLTVRNAQFGCYDAQCSSDKKQITISVVNVSKVCTKDFQLLEYNSPEFSGQIECPKISHFCKDNVNQCENYCNGRGYCKDGLCECLKGFNGKLCDQISL